MNPGGALVLGSALGIDKFGGCARLIGRIYSGFITDLGCKGRVAAAGSTVGVCACDGLRLGGGHSSHIKHDGRSGTRRSHFPKPQEQKPWHVHVDPNKSGLVECHGAQRAREWHAEAFEPILDQAVAVSLKYTSGGTAPRF